MSVEIEVDRDEHGNYYVQLPHQCDHWVIVGDEDGMYPTWDADEPGDHVRSKDEAILQLDAFIGSLHEAMRRLEEL